MRDCALSLCVLSLVLAGSGVRSASASEEVLAFARRVDAARPHVVELTRYSNRVGDGSEPVYWHRQERRGSVTRTSKRTFFVADGDDLVPVPAFKGKETWSDDGVEVRRLMGWLPEDDLPIPVRPPGGAFEEVSGVFGPSDPDISSDTALELIGVRFSLRNGYEELFAASELEVRRLEDAVMPPFPCGTEPFADPTVEVRIAASVHEDQVGVRYFFADRDWPLVATVYPHETQIVVSAVQGVGAAAFPKELWFGRSGDCGRTVIDEVSFEEPDEVVLPVRFPEGIRVLDLARGFNETLIWGRGRPERVLNRSQLAKYSTGREVVSEDIGIEGRGGGRTFWLLNGTLAVVLAALLIIRGRFK